MTTAEKCNYYEDNSDEWKMCYGTNGEGGEGIVEDGEYVLRMGCGGSHWWNYVIDNTGVYVENKEGRTKLNVKLIGDETMTYVSEKDSEYELKDDEYDIYEMITECYEDEFNEYHLNKLEEEEEN